MKRIFIIFMLFFALDSFAQETEVWVKTSPEIRLNFEKNPIEIRWRPFENILMPTHYFGKHSLTRTDLMLGVNVWKFKIFNYSKYDEFNRFWTGIRLDFNLDFFDKKLTINLQERYFWGLNKDSDPHYYFIQFIQYAIHKKVQLGVLCYGTWDTYGKFQDGNWFLGPSVNFVLPYNFSFNIAFTHDLLHKNINMLYTRINYKIKI